MKNNNTMVEIFSVIVILGIFTIAMLSFTSYAYTDNSDSYYDETIHLIERQAVEYGKELQSLKDEGYLVITLSDLVEADYYIADDNDGNVFDPRNKKVKLNGLKIKLTYDEGNVKANIIEED